MSPRLNSPSCIALQQYSAPPFLLPCVVLLHSSSQGLTTLRERKEKNVQKCAQTPFPSSWPFLVAFFYINPQLTPRLPGQSSQAGEYFLTGKVEMFGKKRETRGAIMTTSFLLQTFF